MVHRDLKSQNFLVTEHLAVKICDFGLARSQEDCKLIKQAAGTVPALFAAGSSHYVCAVPACCACPPQPAYMAPELWNGSAPVTKASDVYAFGILLAEIWSEPARFIAPVSWLMGWLRAVRGAFREKEVPWDGIQAAEIKAGVLGGTRPAISKGCPVPVAALIQKCWAKDPTARPTMAKVNEVLDELKA